MADVLTRHLAAAGRAPFRWGALDCFLFPADWVKAQTGADPAGIHRGAYASERAARTLMRGHGGPIAFADALLRAVGCAPTESPRRGDVGIVRVALKQWRERMIFVPAGAICLGDAWAVKTTGSGLVIGEFPVLKAWSLPHA